MLPFFLAWFRLFVGDLSNDVSDEVLANAFSKYTSFQKARVIRDRLSAKAGFSLRNDTSLADTPIRRNMDSWLFPIPKIS